MTAVALAVELVALLVVVLLLTFCILGWIGNDEP